MILVFVKMFVFENIVSVTKLCIHFNDHYKSHVQRFIFLLLAALSKIKYDERQMFLYRYNIFLY